MSGRAKDREEGRTAGVAPSPLPGIAGVLDPRALHMVHTESRLVRAYIARPQSVKVSVVMPTWNRGHILGRAVDSVLRQRYRNLELLVADDGSDDETESTIARRYGHDPRVRYLAGNHAGASAARNLALREASGDFVAYLDTDNEWSENYLLIMVNALLDRPSADCVYAGLRVVDRVARSSFVRLRAYDRASLLERNFIDINIFLHRTSLYERLGGFDPEICAVEDWDLVLRYTENDPPAVVECVLATYYLENGLRHSSQTPELWANYRKVRARFDLRGGGATRPGGDCTGRGK